MIKINKDVDIPTILTNKGAIEEKELCDMHDEDPTKFGNEGEYIFPFDRNIYGHDSVRNKLKECQHNKCCYSEAKFRGGIRPIDHFRPKTCVNEGINPNKLYPGYYWLAYRWENLFLSQPVINSSLKGNYFPLENNDESNRAKNHNMDISTERPLLIDPSKEDPRDHIRFHRDVPYAYKNSKRGQYTINLLLGDPDIADGRLTLVGMLEGLNSALIYHEKQGTDENNAEVEKIRKILNDAIQPCAEFSSMAIDYLS